MDYSTLEPASDSKVFGLEKWLNLDVDEVTEQRVIIDGSFEDFPHFHQPIKKVHDDSSVQAALHIQEVQEAAGKEAPKAELEISEDQGELQLKFASKDYEQLNQVWQDIALEIQQYHQVDIMPEVHLNIKMNTQDGSCHADELETLKASVQSLTTDMENVSISGVKRPNVLQASSKTQKGSLLRTDAQGKVDDITRPKEGARPLTNDMKNSFLDKFKLKDSMKVKSEMSATSMTMKIRKVHWKLMKDVLQKMLEDMNCKYQVIFTNYFTGNITVLLKNKDARRDLPMEALIVFSVLYEQSVKSCTKRTVLSDFWELVIKAYKKRQGVHPDVQLMADQGDEITLVGLPRDVEEAVKDIEEELGQKVFQDRAGQLSESSTIETKEQTDEEEKCSICMNLYVNKMTTPCNHSFCMECWEMSIAFQPMCPTCKRACEDMVMNEPDRSTTKETEQPASDMESPGIAEGIQPEGYMNYRLEASCHLPLSAYPCGTIEIEYFIPSGVQSDKHPDPGQPYSGITKRAYLPDNPEGREVLRLLQKAFEQKLIFIVQKSEKMGAKYVVTWSDIDHKTSKYGGPTEFGYPDPDYLKRITDQLHAKGIH